MMIKTTRSAEETVRFAEEIGKLLKGGDIILFKGGLGAGKTAFTRGLARGLGLPSEDVSSPTFSLVNEYRGENAVLYHFDMYRVTSREVLETTGFYDYLTDGGIIAVEWSENIEDELDEPVITVTLEQIGTGGERRITIEGDGRFDTFGD